MLKLCSFVVEGQKHAQLQSEQYAIIHKGSLWCDSIWHHEPKFFSSQFEFLIFSFYEESLK